MPIPVTIAHDFTCPWCWVALHQARRMQAEFGVEIAWRGYELWPEELEWPAARPASVIPGRPPVPGRLDFLLMLDQIEIPKIERPKKMRVHLALEAVEAIRAVAGAARPRADEFMEATVAGVAHPRVDEFVEGAVAGAARPSVDQFVEKVYRAYWEQGARIGDLDVIVDLAKPHDIRDALETRRYRDRIVHFDAPSYKAGVFNVPTFFIGDEKYAEQPYQVLADALIREAIYRGLEFPSAPKDRPYTSINMVATIDGKILSGGRDEPVVDLGSKHDHALMKRIEAASDAVLLGAQTLRAAKKSWNPQTRTRIVLTRSGDLPFDSNFFTEDAIIATTNSKLETPDSKPQTPNSKLQTPNSKLVFKDLPNLMNQLRESGIQRLLVLGGSNLNAQMFEAGLIDEIFLTVAPKIKLGKDVPTIADGNALPRERIQNYQLVERHQIGDELYLRYRRQP